MTTVVKRLCFEELDKYLKNNDTTGNNTIDIAHMMREKLKELEDIARDFTEHIKEAEFIEGFGNKSETIAQSILGMRHIEDARMKYGKVIQYRGDGVSNFDK